MSQLIRKSFAAQLTVHDGERAVVARITTNSVDRDGEVLIPQGCDASEFEANPVVFYNHDYLKPVGRCAAIVRLPTAIEAKTVLAPRPPEHVGEWLPDTVLWLFQQRVLHGFSVGFTPIGQPRKPSDKDLEQFGPDVRRVYPKWKLLEYSVAPLPANQDALAIAVSKGVVSVSAVSQLFPAAALSTAIEQEPYSPQQLAQLAIERIRGQIFG